MFHISNKYQIINELNIPTCKMTNFPYAADTQTSLENLSHLKKTDLTYMT